MARRAGALALPDQRAAVSFVEQDQRTPRAAWLILAVLALIVVAVFALSCPSLYAAESTPKVSTALFGWKLFVIDREGEAYRRGGDLFGGRAIASVDLSGGLHLGLRGDASALSNFDLKNPGTWRSLEGYAALSRPFGTGPLWTVGPAIMAGALVPVTTEATWSSRSTWGGGVRVSRGRSWGYVLAGRNGAADERSLGASPMRLLFAGQIEVRRVALVGDAVTGPGGFVRAGVAYRIPIPGGKP